MRSRGRSFRASVLAAATPFALVLTACGGGDEVDEPAAGATGGAGATGATAADEHMEDGAVGETEDGHSGHTVDETTEVPEGAHTFEVEATEFEYSITELAVEAGHPVAVTLHNVGLVEHDWTIHDSDGHEIAFAHAKPGEEAVAVFTLDAGTYDVWCTVPGHNDAGMVGTVTAA